MMVAAMQGFHRFLPSVLLAALLVMLSAFPPGHTDAAPARKDSLTVFAAASLTDAFRELGMLFESTTGTPVTFSFGSSSQLRTQLEHGAFADVFASADTQQMDRARQAGVISGAEHVFVLNRLVVITPASNPAGIIGPEDLARPGVKIVTAQTDVPIGVYTQAMFDAMSQDSQYGTGFKDGANANIVSREPNVRQIVAKIQLGEADAAVVYRTDVTPAAAPYLAILDVPDAFNTLAQYPIATVNGAKADAAAQFIALVLSPVGQAVLQRWSFQPVGAVALEALPEGALGQ